MIPSGSVACVDSNVLIYVVEKVAPYVGPTRRLLELATSGEVQLVVSELALVEVLVRAVRNGDTALEARYREVRGAREIRLVPVSRGVLEAALKARAEHKLSTPDAIHVGTFRVAGCSHFVTADRDIGRVLGDAAVVM